MDYANEVKELEAYEPDEWFKPTKGNYKIRILNEGEFVPKDFGEGPVTQWNILVEVDGKPVHWSVTKGKTISSLYGQIFFLAAKNNNTAQGLEFDLIVKFDGKKNDYTIPQAIQNDADEAEEVTEEARA